MKPRWHPHSRGIIALMHPATAPTTLTVYGIANCDTVKKARLWLQSQGLAAEFHDFKKQGLAPEVLANWVQTLGWERLLNRKGTTWRKLAPAQQASAHDATGASALMLAGGAGADGLILSNPWTFEHDTSADGEETAEAPEMPAGALRAHYRSRLANPAAIKRLLTGQISLGSLFGSLLAMLRPAAPPSSLAQNMAAGIAGFTRPVAFLIAEKDRTAQAFLGGWPKADGRVKLCPGASHSFVEEASQEWLVAQVLGVLKGF